MPTWYIGSADAGPRHNTVVTATTASASSTTAVVRLPPKRATSPPRRARVPPLLEIGDGQDDQCQQHEIDVQVLEVALERLGDRRDGQHDGGPAADVTVTANQAPAEQGHVPDRPYALGERQTDAGEQGEGRQRNDRKRWPWKTD